MSAPSRLEALEDLREHEKRFGIARRTAYEVFGEARIPLEVQEEIDRLAEATEQARVRLRLACRAEAKAFEQLIDRRYVVAADCTDSEGGA